MDPGSLHVLIEYNIWANNRILECAAKVPYEELARPANIDHGSAFQTLLHKSILCPFT